MNLPTKRVTNYTVVPQDSAVMLAVDVVKKIQEGWQPVGGAFSVKEVFYQTMFKYEERQTDEETQKILKNY